VDGGEDSLKANAGRERHKTSSHLRAKAQVRCTPHTAAFVTGREEGGWRAPARRRVQTFSAGNYA